MDHAEVKEALQLFIEKADRLANSNFVKNTHGNSGIQISHKLGEPAMISRTGPDQENIDAFVLTFRFFIQDNERISMRNFTNIFHHAFALPEETKQFDEARDYLNSFLDGSTMFNLNGGKLLRRHLMDVFIYGGLSHAIPEKKKTFDEWMEFPMLPQLFTNEFVVILYEVLNVIVFVRNMCEAFLKRLK